MNVNKELQVYYKKLEVRVKILKHNNNHILQTIQNMRIYFLVKDKIIVLHL